FRLRGIDLFGGRARVPPDATRGGHGLFVEANQVMKVAADPTSNDASGACMHSTTCCSLWWRLLLATGDTSFIVRHCIFLRSCAVWGARWPPCDAARSQ